MKTTETLKKIEFYKGQLLVTPEQYKFLCYGDGTISEEVVDFPAIIK